MARREGARRPSPFDKKLAHIRELREQTPPDATELGALLRDPEPYVAGRAAEAIGDLGLRACVADLVSALTRLVGGEQPDTGCMASHPTATALTKLDADAPEVFRRGLSYVRRERVGIGFVDRAIGVRIECAVGLVRCVARGALLDLVPLLVDPEPAVRAGVARAIAGLPGDGPAAVLHLKLSSEEPDADVLGACMLGLLDLDADRYLPLVAKHLADDRLAEIAAISLGESRRPEALPSLRRALESDPSERQAAALTLAMALLRTPEANETLLDVVERGAARIAAHAVRALGVQRHVEPLAERVRAAVERRGGRNLTEAYAEAFARAAGGS